MTSGRLTEERLRSGIWTVGALTSTYEISRLAVSAGDTDDSEFWVFSAEGSTAPTPARVSQTADGGRSSDGFMQWQKRMSYMNFNMLNTWLTTFDLVNNYSAPVTVMTYDLLNQPVYLTALMLKPDDFQWAPDGYQNVIWRFVNGIVIT